MCSGGLAHMEWSHKLHPSRSTGCTAEWNNCVMLWFWFFFFLHQDGETAKWKHSFTELCLRSFYCSSYSKCSPDMFCCICCNLLVWYLSYASEYFPFSHLSPVLCELPSCFYILPVLFFLQCFGEVFPSSLNSWIHKIKKWIKNYLNRTWQQSQKIHNLNKLKNRWETQLYTFINLKRLTKLLQGFGTPVNHSVNYSPQMEKTGEPSQPAYKNYTNGVSISYSGSHRRIQNNI